MCSRHYYLGWVVTRLPGKRERGQSEDSCVAGTVTECITELSAGHASGLALGDDEGLVGALEADSTAVL